MEEEEEEENEEEEEEEGEEMRTTWECINQWYLYSPMILVYTYRTPDEECDVTVIREMKKSLEARAELREEDKLKLEAVKELEIKVIVVNTE